MQTKTLRYPSAADLRADLMRLKRDALSDKGKAIKSGALSVEAVSAEHEGRTTSDCSEPHNNGSPGSSSFSSATRHNLELGIMCNSLSGNILLE
jgi:hypothetical protein